MSGLGHGAAIARDNDEAVGRDPVQERGIVRRCGRDAVPPAGNRVLEAVGAKGCRLDHRVPSVGAGVADRHRGVRAALRVVADGRKRLSASLDPVEAAARPRAAAVGAAGGSTRALAAAGAAAAAARRGAARSAPRGAGPAARAASRRGHAAVIRVVFQSAAPAGAAAQAPGAGPARGPSLARSRLRCPPLRRPKSRARRPRGRPPTSTSGDGSPGQKTLRFLRSSRALALGQAASHGEYLRLALLLIEGAPWCGASPSAQSVSERYARSKVGQARERLRLWLSGPHFYWSLRRRHNVVSAPSPVAGAVYRTAGAHPPRPRLDTFPKWVRGCGERGTHRRSLAAKRSLPTCARQAPDGSDGEGEAAAIHRRSFLKSTASAHLQCAKKYFSSERRAFGAATRADWPRCAAMSRRPSQSGHSTFPESKARTMARSAGVSVPGSGGGSRGKLKTTTFSPSRVVTSGRRPSIRRGRRVSRRRCRPPGRCWWSGRRARSSGRCTVARAPVGATASQRCGQGGDDQPFVRVLMHEG